MPKSHVRKKAVYTPPQRSTKAKGSPPWIAPAIVACLVLGVVWIAVFYFSNQGLPIPGLGQWNLVIGFGLLTFSSVPVLNAIGSTVGLGAILSLIFSAVLIRRPVAGAAEGVPTEHSVSR